MKIASLLILATLVWVPAESAPLSGSIAGTVSDSQGISLSGAKVTLLDQKGQALKEVSSGMAGDFEFYPVALGDYSLRVSLDDYQLQTKQVKIGSEGHADVEVQLLEKSVQAVPKEITLKVKAKKNAVASASSHSSREVNHEMIESLPQGDDVKLPKLLATTTPGIIEGPFGQTFVRGNHANIQYQIDGVQLPDSPSSAFGQAFSPRNIDRMEVITGGIPAEYGERLAAVVNIVTKSGAEVPGGSAQIGYGTYNTLTPQLNYSGSSASGTFHYYVSGAFNKTDRGLDTPQPKSATEITQGGKDAVHDFSNGNDEFLKLDWQLTNDDKLSMIIYNSYSFYEIPNFPSSFAPNSSSFSANDQFGNSPLHYSPSTTNDTQAENNAYAQAVWRHALTPTSFLQIAPYYKFSKLVVTNDPSNDLFQASYAPNPADSSSFASNRSTNNFGFKSDYSNRLSDADLLKIGVQIQSSKTVGSTTVLFKPASGSLLPASIDASDEAGDFESVYVQDDHQLSSALSLNAGVRVDATQFQFADASTHDSWVEPRIGLNYMATPTTKLHAFWGLLFQPAPVENLRDTFKAVSSNPTTLAPYDIKAEKDSYYELGVSQQVRDQALGLNVYGKTARNMLDDSQLLNTSIAQPYNFHDGYAYGAEFSVNGKINESWTDYANYSYEIAKGRGLGGGLFASPEVSSGYQFLDHVQVHTANAGVTYKQDHWWWSGQGLFGSGLRTGDGNSLSLPSHLTFDSSVGYEFGVQTNSWLSKMKLSLDLLNVTDNVYPITIANGFNGSHYAVGREVFVRVGRGF